MILLKFLVVSTCILSQSQVKVDLDLAVFRGDTAAARLVEFYYSIPYDELVYTKLGDTLLAEYRTTLTVRSLDRPDSVIDRRNNQFVIPSFAYAWSHNLQVLDRISFLLRPGRYECDFTVACSTKAAKQSRRISIEPDTNRFGLSDILLALNIIQDSTSTKFTKNQLQVIPNPSANYDVKNRLLYGYVEIYAPPGAADYAITYHVFGAKGDTVKAMERQEPKISTSQTHVWAMNIAALKPGDYTMAINVRDLTSGGEALSRRPFHIVKQGQRSYRPAAVMGGKYYRDIKYLVSEKEYKRFLSYSPEGQDSYLAAFWKKYDYDEFERRIDHVDDQYTVANRKGSQTDRGRIYIKYGPPEEIVAHSFETGYKPNEHWKYYNPNLHFIFVDLRGTGDYLLVFSSDPRERTDPNWQRYVDPEEEDRWD